MDRVCCTGCAALELDYVNITSCHVMSCRVWRRAPNIPANQPVNKTNLTPVINTKKRQQNGVPPHASKRAPLRNPARDLAIPPFPLSQTHRIATRAAEFERRLTDRQRASECGHAGKNMRLYPRRVLSVRHASPVRAPRWQSRGREPSPGRLGRGETPINARRNR